MAHVSSDNDTDYTDYSSYGEEEVEPKNFTHRMINDRINDMVLVATRFYGLHLLENTIDGLPFDEKRIRFDHLQSTLQFCWYKFISQHMLPLQEKNLEEIYFTIFGRLYFDAERERKGKEMFNVVQKCHGNKLGCDNNVVCDDQCKKEPNRDRLVILNGVDELAKHLSMSCSIHSLIGLMRAYGLQIDANIIDLKNNIACEWKKCLNHIVRLNTLSRDDLRGYFPILAKCNQIFPKLFEIFESK